MEKPEDTSDNDIATERYKGPGTLVTGAGEGAIAHYGTGFAGLVGGGIASYFFPETVGKVEAAFEKFSQGNNGQGILRRLAGSIQKLSNEAAHHLPGSKTVLKHVPTSRLQAVIFGGGLAGVFGFFIAPLYFMITGAKHSNEGRVQFNRAQDEILTVRAERDALRDKYVDAQIELETVRGRMGHDDALTVAKDNPPRMDKPREEAIAALDAAPQLDSPTAPTAPVIGPAPTTGRTLPGEPPRIQEPVIGPETAPSTVVENALLADRVAAHSEQHDAARA